MNATPQSFAARDRSVVMGSPSYIGVLLRLIGMELYKMRRRAMSKVLSIIAILVAASVFLILSLGTVFVVNSPPESFAQRQCVPSTQGSSSCTQPQYTPAQLQQFKQEAVRSASEPLRLPLSLNIAVQVALTPFTVLIMILVGAIVGGEFSIGTVRLMYTRGPTRTQFLLAKVGAALVCSVIGLLLMTMVGALAGLLLNLISGIPQTFDFLTSAWLEHAVLYVLAAILNWFMFAMIAFFFGVLGRSSVAGIVSALTWFFVESLLAGGFALASDLLHMDWLKYVPDYFIGNNLSALQENQLQYLLPERTAASLSDGHALLVLAVYLAVFIGLACWVNMKRDVTN
jgi:ABC-type transport system involved in multi-copper enzyme maturation permease subunit